MSCTDEVLNSFRKIKWRSATVITPNAESLIRDHIVRMNAVLEHLEKTRHLSALEGYAEAQSAGHKVPGYRTCMDTLFREAEFRGAGVREPLILTACSYCFWSQDADLGHLPNPWAPLMTLYEMGYTSSFDEDEQQQKLRLLVGYQGGIQAYPMT